MKKGEKEVTKEKSEIVLYYIVNGVNVPDV